MVRVGVVGPGSWALGAHVPALRAAGAEVVAVCGRDPERTRAAAASLALDGADAPASVSTLDALFAVPELEAVLVTTPPRAHAEAVRAALEAGLHVICESPLTPDAASARELADLASERGLITGYTRPRPFNFNGAALRDLLTEGRIGTPRRATFELSGHPWLRATPAQTWRVRADAGPSPLAGLSIGLATAILGPIAEIDGRLRVSDGDPERAPDELVAHLRSSSGVLAAVQAGWSAQPRMAVTVYGDGGGLHWDMARGGAIQIAAESGWEPLQEPAPERFTAPSEFLAAIRAGAQHELGFARAVHELEAVERISPAP